METFQEGIDKTQHSPYMALDFFQFLFSEFQIMEICTSDFIKDELKIVKKWYFRIIYVRLRSN
jgi:hypothetical protein